MASVQTVVALLEICYCLLQQFVSVFCTMDCMPGFLYTGYPLRKTTGTCGYNEVVDIDPVVQIKINSSFLMNAACIWGTEMAASLLDTEIAIETVVTFLIKIKKNTKIKFKQFISKFIKRKFLEFWTKSNSSHYF